MDIMDLLSTENKLHHFTVKKPEKNRKRRHSGHITISIYIPKTISSLITRHYVHIRRPRQRNTKRKTPGRTTQDRTEGSSFVLAKLQFML